MCKYLGLFLSIYYALSLSQLLSHSCDNSHAQHERVSERVERKAKAEQKQPASVSTRQRCDVSSAADAGLSLTYTLSHLLALANPTLCVCVCGFVVVFKCAGSMFINMLQLFMLLARVFKRSFQCFLEQGAAIICDCPSLSLSVCLLRALF